jgi:phosphoribosylaminoimidazolecarboxamide formyltransferase / IMP cyclohydrolase
MKIQRALISVSDKTGIVDFAKIVASTGAELLSTGGTAKTLREAGLNVKDVSDHTGFPEMMDGRVKTLHPKIHGGLLQLRGNSDHERQARQYGILPIDLVVVSLYPFEATIRKGCTHEEAIEQIDIGGPSMLRSAAKNHSSVTVIVDPADYAVVAAELNELGNTTLPTRQRLAVKVFETTGRYDSTIGAYLGSQYCPGGTGGETAKLPENFSINAHKIQELRYGENPHQAAALYGDFYKQYEQLQGKELSYNNILDLTAAVDLISEFKDTPTIAILKHNNPCGVGQGDSLEEAWENAFATDRQAPFGGIIVTNRPVTQGLAAKISEIFSEVIIAPAFEPEARTVFEKKKNLRLMIQKSTEDPVSIPASLEVRRCPAGYLVQERDVASMDEAQWKVVTKRQPTAEEWQALRFGWRIVKHVKSNAIVYAGKDRTLGIGAGQMSRVDSSKIAVWKASEAKLDLKGSVVASDAFFPFPDGLIASAQAGATAAIQPGGSVKDAEVIAAADERGLAMVFTGRRHFRH